MNEDQNGPCIVDVQLLPGGRLVLADVLNVCVQLFDTQGQHVHTLECRSRPYRLALLDSSSIGHTVAMTLPYCAGIDLLELVGDSIKVKKTLQTSIQYDAVAAVYSQTLAVGHGHLDIGIDLMDLGGQVLRRICSNVWPYYMDITQDGDLVCSTDYNTIARVQVDTGTITFDTSDFLLNPEIFEDNQSVLLSSSELRR
ncbi:hypothetical protein PoB_007602800 [Plakobranchus ocellatus]|uniref:Uncharacterized protein n=1 Tax=Plakobranchus ocellatus TaxID=259542 RepID=A0AAV4DZK4_9GAST|nr:hypothetical protein PoB_007602800 [Plakobranchus ocellatus]